MAASLRFKLEALHFGDTGSVPTAYIRSESEDDPLVLAATEWNKVSRDELTLSSAGSEALLAGKPAGDLVALVLLSDVPIYFRMAASEERVVTRCHVMMGTRTRPIVAAADFDFRVQAIAAVGNANLKVWFYTYEA